MVAIFEVQPILQTLSTLFWVMVYKERPVSVIYDSAPVLGRIFTTKTGHSTDFRCKDNFFGKT